MHNNAADAAAWQVVAAVIIFLVTYGIIITEKINRAIVASIGALLMLVLGLVDFKAIFSQHVEWRTLVLMIGIMVIAGFVGKSGVLQYAAVRMAQQAKGSPLRILWMLALLSAACAAALDNITAVLLIAPVTFSIAKTLKISAVPYLITEIIASNIGGTATLIGSASNMMLGTAAGFDFLAFLVHAAPVALLILVLTVLGLSLVYGRQMKVSADNKTKLMELDAGAMVTDRTLMIQSLSVLGLTLLGFILHDVIRVDSAVLAIGGAALMLLLTIRRFDKKDVLHSVEWATVLSLAGLFVVSGGLADSGVISRLVRFVMETTGADAGYISMLFLWVSGLLSATIDNTPFVAAMIPALHELGIQLNGSGMAPEAIWWGVVLGTGLGGNGTLLGASSNLIVAGMSHKEGQPVAFIRFIKMGIPVTLISLSAATVYVYLIF